MLNPAGNTHNPLSPDAFDVFAFKVTFPVGTRVIGAASPTDFTTDTGSVQPFGGVATPTLFDVGFGTYSYNSGNGWKIDYEPDHVSWLGTLAGGTAALQTSAAAGAVNAGGSEHCNPAFALFFDPNTPLGLNQAEVDGFRDALTSIGHFVFLNGYTLSAVVPLPPALWLLASALVGIGVRLRREIGAHWGALVFFHSAWQRRNSSKIALGKLCFCGASLKHRDGLIVHATLCPTSEPTARSLNLSQYDAIALSKPLRHKQLEVVEVVEWTIRQIERLNPTLNALIHRMDESTRDRASMADDFTFWHGASASRGGAAVVERFARGTCRRAVQRRLTHPSW